MGRKAIFGRADMTGAALRLVADRGPAAVTVSAVAREAGAPTGSIYHRYRSRDQLLAELWLDVVESFQAGFVSALAGARDVQAGLAAARFMVSWSREHPLEARLLLLHRRQDFMTGDWPRELAGRAAALEPQLGAALRAFGERVCGKADSTTMARLRYALLDAPFGAIHPYVQSRKRMPSIVDDLVAETAAAVLGGLARD